VKPVGDKIIVLKDLVKDNIITAELWDHVDELWNKVVGEIYITWKEVIDQLIISGKKK